MVLFFSENLPVQLQDNCNLSDFLVGKFGEAHAVTLINQVNTAVKYVSEAQTEINMPDLYNYVAELKQRSNWNSWSTAVNKKSVIHSRLFNNYNNSKAIILQQSPSEVP